MLEESTRDHFIDVTSRKMAMDALNPDIQKASAIFLDAGCSTGWLLDDATSQFPGWTVIGTDPVFSGLRKFQNRSGGGRITQSDLCRSPFRDAVFDAIACINVLEHIDDDVQALQEIYRMLKPGGSAFIMVPAGPSLYDYYDEVHQHVRRYAKCEFRDKLQRGGFMIRRISYVGIFLFPAFYAVKKLGQWKMRNKTMNEKKYQVMKNIGGRVPGIGSIMAKSILTIERKFGFMLPQVFGIRLCAHVGRRPSQ